MTQQSYRANLSAAIFPLTLASAGRSVIIPGSDNTYDRRVDPEGEQKNAGIPQAIYLENVIPTANGYQSVGLKQLGPTTPFTSGLKIYRVSVIDGYTYVFGQDAASTDFIYRTSDLITWTNVTAYWLSLFGPPYIEGWGTYNTLSQAEVRGTKYIYVRNGSILASVSGAVFTDVSGTLSGIASTDINSITTSYNYLIAILRDNSVAWSSTTDPLDFTFSLVSGAGSTTPEAVRGNIVAVHRCPEGFILYTETNTVLATYTGNSRYPWKFREISNSGGHSSERMIAAPEDSQYHFTINAQGNISQIFSDGVRPIASEVSTYLRTFKGSYDKYNLTANTIDVVTEYLFPYQISFVANRYIIVQLTNQISGGILPKQSIIFDTLLKRYGRFGDNHLFFWSSADSIYCMTADGKACKVVFDIHDSTVLYPGIVVLGKFQYVRSRRLEIDEVIFEGELPSVTSYILSSLDGNIPAAGVQLIPYQSNDNTLASAVRAEGLNHMIALKGRFDISTLELTFHPGGAR